MCNDFCHRPSEVIASSSGRLKKVHKLFGSTYLPYLTYLSSLELRSGIYLPRYVKGFNFYISDPEGASSWNLFERFLQKCT